MRQTNLTLEWAKNILEVSKKYKITNLQEVEHKSYSIVWKIEADQGTFYLKQTPQELYSEPSIINFLTNIGCNNVPKLVNKNDTLKCFLMQSCGEQSLRTIFNGEAQLDLLEIGIKNFTTIQRQLEDSIPQMLSLGIPDWRLDKFPLLYRQLINQDKLLIADGMSKDEIIHLHKLENVCADLCADLMNDEIPETISHNDFHENNMILERSTGNVNIIDWGETVTTHPFFSLCGCLWNLTYFQNIKETSPIYKKLQQICINPWLDLLPEEHLLKALKRTTILNGIYAALGYEKMYIATNHEENNVQKEHHGSIAGCLRSFISAALL
jgi:hypothetical protein